MPLDKAYANDFFQFFKFRVVGVSITKDGFMEIIFKPPKLKPERTSVQLNVVLHKDGKIKRMRLALDRQFIDDKKQGMFARDYAKSFLQVGVHDDDYKAVKPLVNEIFFRQKLTPVVLGNKKFQGTLSIFKLGEGKLTSGDIIIIGSGGNIPKLPKKESSLYKCFAGKTANAQIDMSKSTVRLENIDQDRKKVHLIIIGPKEDLMESKTTDFDFRSFPLNVPK